MKSPLIPRARKTLGRRHIANASALSAITLGVIGVMLGTGVATTAIGVSDGITWLSDSRSGEVLQYNPSTKRVERSYQVGRPGDDISVSQDSGLVALRNERTGEVITVDMSRLRAAGARAAGGPAKVLVAKGMMVIVDRQTGILRRIDPVKATDLGQPWRNTAPVADAVADEQGTFWVMVADGHLRALVWNEEKQRFDQTSETRIQRVADDGLLAAHPAGVTVFGPRAGVIAQVGTPNDSYRQSNQLVGIAPQATAGPSDLVVGALANNSSVVIIDRGEVRRVSTAELGCVRPVNPAAFNSRVYVVCQGGNKVIQLRRDGRVAGPEIPTPGSGDAQPVADEGRLVLNVSGAREGIEIDRAGSDQRFDRTAEVIPPTMRVESKPTDEGMELGREQARSDLVVEPLPGQPDSGSGNVSTSPEVFEDRTEVVDGGRSPEAAPSAEAPLPEAAVETPEPPAPEAAPPQPEAESRGAERERESSYGVERTRPAPDADEYATTPGAEGPQAAPTRTAATEAESAPTTPSDDPAPVVTADSEDEAPIPTTTAPSEPAPGTDPAPRSDAVPSGSDTAEASGSDTAERDSAATGSEIDPSAPVSTGVPSASAPTDPAPTDPAPTDPALTGSLVVPTSSATAMRPSASPSGPSPGATARAAVPAGANTARPMTPTPSTGARAATPRPPTAAPTASTPASAAAQLAGSTTSNTPIPLPAPARLSAKANGSSVTVTWAYSGDADRFDVAVGGRTVRVVGSARTATVTGSEPGTKKVTVTAVRGTISRAAETAVTVGPAATTPGAPTPAGAVSTPRLPTSTTTGPTPTPTQSSGPPATPTRPRGTHSGTIATVQFDRVAGATDYTISCDDYGATTITGTTGTVACGPDSAGRRVKLGVRANNAAGSSATSEVWVDAT